MRPSPDKRYKKTKFRCKNPQIKRTSKHILNPTLTHSTFSLSGFSKTVVARMLEFNRNKRMARKNRTPLVDTNKTDG